MKKHLCSIVFLACCIASSSTGIAAESRTEAHIDQAIKGGLEPVDYHHLLLATGWRHTQADWKTLAAGLSRLELVTKDPLMVSELAVIRSRMALAEGRPADALAAFRKMGGLERWWVTDAVSLPELEDFDQVATLPKEGADWRFVPGTDAKGWVRMEGINWPVHRQVAFLATTVHSESVQPFALRIGVAEVAKAWVNGIEVLRTDAPLDRAPDQAAGGGWLRQGENLLVVAIGTESGDWWLRARLTDPEGASLKGVHEKDLTPVSYQAVDRASPEIRTVEAAILEGVEQGDADAKLALAAYLVDRRPRPRTSGVAREACRNARGVDPAAARLLEWLVTTEQNQIRDLLEEAIGLDGSLTPARVGLAQWYHDRGLDEVAVGLLKDSEEVWPAMVQLDINSQRWGALVLHRMVQLSRENPNAAEPAVLAMRRALDARWWPQAREVSSRLESLVPGLPSFVELKQRLAQECGDGNQLREIALSGLEQDPNQPALRVRVARTELAEERQDEAVSVLQEGIDRCPSHPDLLLELALVEHRRGNDDQAADLANRLLEVRPQDRRAQRLLELLGGEGEDRSWLRTPDELWKITEEIEASTEPATVVVHHTELRFLPGNLTEERVQRAVLVHTADQIESLRRYDIPFVPERQRLRVLSARILRRDGSELNARKAETPRLSEPEFSMYYDTRLRVLQFPELEDGDLIEVSYVLSETAEANDTGPYDGGLVRLAGPLSIHLSELQLEGPEELLPKWEIVSLPSQDVQRTLEDGSLRLSWQWRDVGAVPREIPQSPGLLVTPFMVYSNHPEWRDLSNWYARHVQPRIRVSRELEELAQDLVRGAADRKEKIAAIYRFVSNEVRYVGLELGEHRFRPFSADWVNNHRIGDCKDKGALLVALFNVVGIPANLVLVRTSDLGPVPSDLAVLEAFNHVIAYLPEDDLWLDGTAAGHDPFIAPGMDQGAWVLIIDEETTGPETIPTVGTGTAQLFCRLEQGETPGEIEVELRTEDTGDAASRRRSRLFGVRNPRRFESWLQSIFPGAEVIGEPELDMPPSRDPARFEIHGRIPRSALLTSGGVPAYPGRVSWASSLAPNEKRSSPLLIPSRPKLSWSMEVKLGKLEDGLPEDVELNTDFGEFSLVFKELAGGYRVDGSFELKPGLVEPEQAPRLRTFLLLVEEAMRRPVEVP